ncbi:outer membrane protein [Terrihabitans sp. B22-R8]|uniref:outer membrane protein n=1 Tax=Terrihabitans sp. B22-R8 TaxID=3425128 RepID=UPI00403CB257
MLTSKLAGVVVLGGATLMSTMVSAADMPDFVEPAPIEAVQFGGWYLRGDVGITNQRVDDFSSPIFFLPGADFDLVNSDFDASALLGLGVGYRFNKHLRVDVTGEHRFESDFNGLDFYYDGDGDLAGSNVYTGSKSEWVVLANAYFDLPSYGIMTPFVGAGIGAARVKIADFTDFNPVVPGTATGVSGDTETWNFAWALHAGLAFDVSRNWTFEVAYRYLNLGDASTDNLLTPDGVDFQFNPYNFDNIDSHDVKVAVRYQFN